LNAIFQVSVTERAAATLFRTTLLFAVRDRKTRPDAFRCALAPSPLDPRFTVAAMLIKQIDRHVFPAGRTPAHGGNITDRRFALWEQQPL
jgi:hypothetical protein